MRCTSHSKLRYISHLFSQCDVRRIGLWGVVGFGFGVDFDLGFSDYGGSDLGVIGFSSVFGIRLLGFGFRGVSIRGPW